MNNKYYNELNPFKWHQLLKFVHFRPSFITVGQILLNLHSETLVSSLWILLSCIGIANLLSCTAFSSPSSVKNLLTVLLAQNEWYQQPRSECSFCIWYTKFRICLSGQNLQCKRNSDVLQDALLNPSPQDSKHSVYFFVRVFQNSFTCSTQSCARLRWRLSVPSISVQMWQECFCKGCGRRECLRSITPWRSSLAISSHGWMVQLTSLLRLPRRDPLLAPLNLAWLLDVKNIHLALFKGLISVKAIKRWSKPCIKLILWQTSGGLSWNLAVFPAMCPW